MSAARRALLVLGPCLALACAAPWSRPIWERPPPPSRDGPVVQPGSLHRTDLDNGLRVLVLEDRRLPRVSVGVTFRRGEAIVELAKAGLAPFTAELMKRGAGSRDALALARAVDEIGASLSVAAGWDSMSVGVAGLSRDLDRLLEILADVVLRPRFERAEARKARGEQLALLEKQKDDPRTLVRWQVARVLYPEHRYGLPFEGTPASVTRLDARAARAFQRRVMLPNDAILFASGDVSAADLLERAGRLFGAWKPANVPEVGPTVPDPTPPGRRVVVVDRPDLVQAHITLAHEGISRTDPERIAAALMNSVLGGSGFSSRLMARVRADAGLTYGVWSGFALRRQPGPFAVGTFTRVSEVRRVVDLLLGELERAREVPPDAAELRDAQTLATGRFALGLETPDAVIASLVDLDVYGLPEDALDTYRHRVRATTIADTERAARRLLHPQRAAIVVVGPAEQLTPQLEDLGAVLVEQP